jgi:hypothetical protein
VHLGFRLPPVSATWPASGVHLCTQLLVCFWGGKVTVSGFHLHSQWSGFTWLSCCSLLSW